MTGGAVAKGSAGYVAIERVSAGYGDSVVLDEVSLEVGEGASLAILGRTA